MIATRPLIHFKRGNAVFEIFKELTPDGFQYVGYRDGVRFAVGVRKDRVALDLIHGHIRSGSTLKALHPIIR